jgi:hypothetical protein
LLFKPFFAFHFFVCVCVLCSMTVLLQLIVAQVHHYNFMMNYRVQGKQHEAHGV